VPTNVISITDGQIFLETDLFQRGYSSCDERRYLGCRASVALLQTDIIKKLGGGIRLALAQ